MINYLEIFEHHGMDYDTYRKIVNDLLAEGRTTGPDHSESMLHYTKMNVQRMNRVDKTAVLNSELMGAIQQIKGNYKLLVITEGWCGDAAQIIPVIHKIALSSPAQFELRFVLRDQNLPLIDAHLTNGGRAIPVLLILDESKNDILAKWGPRPQILQSLLKSWRAVQPDQILVAEQLHGWYAKDKTQTTQFELAAVLNDLETK